MRMRIVITGAQGFVGTKLVAQLVKENFDIIAVSKNPPPDKPLASVVYHQADLSNPADLLPKQLKKQKFILVHLAWKTTRDNLFQTQAAHVTYLAGLLDYWKDKGLSYVIAIGSAEEYGQKTGILNEEMGSSGYFSPYGWAKQAAYVLTKTWSQQNDISGIWFRPFTIYGVGQTGQMLIPYAINQAISKKLAKFGDGLQERDFIHVDDVISALLAGIFKRPKGFYTINLGTGQPTQVKKVIESIAEEFHVKPLFKLGAIPKQKNSPSVQVADNTKAKELLDWKPTISVKKGLSLLYKKYNK